MLNSLFIYYKIKKNKNHESTNIDLTYKFYEYLNQPPKLITKMTKLDELISMNFNFFKKSKGGDYVCFCVAALLILAGSA